MLTGSSTAWWRFYLALTLLVLASLLLISRIYDAATLRPQLLYPPEQALLPALFAVAETGQPIGDLALQQLSLADLALPADLASQLAAGGMVVLQDEQQAYYFYRQHRTQAGVVQAIGPVHYQQAASGFRLEELLPYALLAVALALFCWPLFRDIRRLQRYCQQISEVDFQGRLQLGASSLLSGVGETLTRMAEKLAFHHRQQRDFLNAVSHDFLTPLARMRFTLVNARLMPASPLPLDSLTDDIAELEALIDEFLSHSELRQYRPFLQRQQFSARAIIEPCYQRLLPLTPATPALQLQLAVDDIELHQGCFSRIVQNLLSNAMRHARSQVKLSLWMDNGLVLCVEDDGPGFADQQLPQLLQAFVQGETSSSRLYQGKGLGLSSVALLCRYAGATFTLATSPGLTGAAVTVHFAPPGKG